LALVRLKRSDEALGELRRAAELAPDQPRYYVYAVGLHSAGRREEAMAVLKESLVRHPADRDATLAIVGFSREAGDTTTALQYAERLARYAPDDPDLASLVEELRRQAAPAQ
jgi:Flp pilus assembly protein TadD